MNWQQQMMQNLDISEDQMAAMAQNLGDEQIRQGVQAIVNQQVAPNLAEIRQRADSGPDAEEVREQYAKMPDDKQQDAFNTAISSVVDALVLCRENPTEGLPKLKGLLRDPYTSEALLLIFRNEEHIDPEYSEQMIEFGAAHLRWIGALVLPEMYSQAEAQAVMEELGGDDTFDTDAAEEYVGD